MYFPWSSIFLPWSHSFPWPDHCLCFWFLIPSFFFGVSSLYSFFVRKWFSSMYTWGAFWLPLWYADLLAWDSLPPSLLFLYLPWKASLSWTSNDHVNASAPCPKRPWKKFIKLQWNVVFKNIFFVRLMSPLEEKGNLLGQPFYNHEFQSGLRDIIVEMARRTAVHIGS